MITLITGINYVNASYINEIKLKYVYWLFKRFNFYISSWIHQGNRSNITILPTNEQGKEKREGKKRVSINQSVFLSFFLTDNLDTKIWSITCQNVCNWIRKLDIRDFVSEGTDRVSLKIVQLYPGRRRKHSVPGYCSCNLKGDSDRSITRPSSFVGRIPGQLNTLVTCASFPNTNLLVIHRELSKRMWRWRMDKTKLKLKLKWKFKKK